MKSWDEYAKGLPKYPDSGHYYNWQLFVYSNGKCIDDFRFKIRPSRSMIAEQEDRGVVELKQITDPEFDAAVQAHTDAYSEAAARWTADLRAEYSYLSDGVFSLCYQEAYERGHSSGYNEVANIMISVANFAVELIERSKI